MKARPVPSEAEKLARLSPEGARRNVMSWGEARTDRSDRWPFWCRDTQLPPPSSWKTWLVMAGRGFGKTRIGAEMIHAAAQSDGRLRIALIGATLTEARSVMVEGESGLLSLFGGEKLMWEPSLKKLTWPNGAMASLYSAGEPESLRGPQHHFAWADEIAKWPHGIATWDNMMLGLRLGVDPRIVATTTPRPVPLVRRLITQKDVVMTQGSSHDNAGYLPPAFLQAMTQAYGGTRLGRQELDGELIADAQGALWTRDLIEKCRARTVPEFRRIVVGVDPPASANGDACGIIVVAKGANDRAYVLDDASVSGRSPEGWAQAVAAAAARWNADRVIAEKNQGGDMVGSVLKAANIALPIKLVHASRGKVARAEPVAALYEGGRACHVGAFPELEDELCGLILGGGYEGPGKSPDRADACVWAMTELMLGAAAPRPRVRLV